MATSAQIPETDRPAQITDHVQKPAGVISRSSQHYLVLGVSVVIVLVALFSSNRQRKPAAAVASSLNPMIHEGNERKLADYSAELAQESAPAQRHESLPPLPQPSNPTATNGMAAGSGTAQYRDSGGTTADQEKAERNALAANERERLFNSRFASNIAFAVRPVLPASAQGRPFDPDAESQPAIEPVEGRPISKPKKPINVNVNDAMGQPYVLFEGTLIETTLVTRLDGDFSGPVKVMVTNPVYSHDRQHVLIPDGSSIVGEVKPVQGFGQRRLAVVFHRLIMPDGYSVDLDQFDAMNQVGETGLRDEVNNHYARIFGSSIALGVIAGAAESSTPNVGLYASGADAYRTGVASNISQTSTRVLDKFMNITPTLTIREGHRIKIYLRKDLLLPAWENHMVPPNI